MSLSVHLAQLRVSGSRAFSSSAACASRTYKHITRRKAFNQDLYLNPRNAPQVGDKKADFKVVIPLTKPKYPPYPYGESFTFKRGDRALFGGRTLANGYRSSEFKNKTLRKWKPNAQKTTLPSEALGKNIRITTVPRVLSTIRREGGLDAYLTKDTPLRIKEIGVFGWKLRHKILAAKNYYSDKEFQPIQTPKGVWKHSWGIVQLDGKTGDLIAKKATLADHLYAVQCYQQMKEGHQPMARGFFNRKTSGWSAVKFFNSLRDAKVDVSDYVLFGGLLRNKNSAMLLFKQAREKGVKLSN
ncbi:54S ribosomal protein L24 [Yarrowia sp. C11]|nr:54S ribosomal protein L24 [Yarrowia sp. E02]KAG5373016.1 54S ribosomal protein L24 [Yarrowia sp. C11]